MAKLPDLAAYSMEELTELGTAVEKRMDELKKTRIAELQQQKAALDAELAKLSGAKTSRASGEGRKRASPKVTHRGPNGETWSNRGAKPRWLTSLLDAGHKEEEFRVSE